MAKIADLKFDTRNANKHSEYGMQRLEKSIGKIGLGRSILISDDNEIIAGNGVTESAINAGIDKVRIIETDGTEIIAVKRTDIKSGSKEFYEMALSDNIIAKENIIMDVEVTNAICEEFELEEYKLESDEKELPEAVDDDFDVPDGGIETDIVLGDLFEIGEHRLLCGDSTDSDQVAKLMNGQKADMVLTDPPYNIAYKSGTWSKRRKANMKEIENDKMNETDFIKFLTDVFNLFHIYTKDTDKYIFNDWKCFHLFRDACINSSLKISNVIVWNKEFQTQALNKFANAHELIIFIGNNKYPMKDINVWNCKREFDKEHPTPKPVELLNKAINYSSKINDLIFDIFLGSGSTMVASHQLKRKCYGMELDPKYCQVIIDRMKKLDPSLEIKRNGEIIK